jgi:hypothetical protein
MGIGFSFLSSDLFQRSQFGEIEMILQALERIGLNKKTAESMVAMKTFKQICIAILVVLTAGTAHATFDSMGNIVEQGSEEQRAALSIPNMMVPYESISGTVINFDDLQGNSSLGSGEILGAQFINLGVTFDVPNFNAYATTGLLANTPANSDPNVIWIDQAGGASGSLALGMNINFSPAVSQVELLVLTSLNSTATLSIYDGATLLESLTVTLSPRSDGLGLEGFVALSGSNITKAIISSANSSGQNWNFAIDDLTFAGAPTKSVMIDVKPGSFPNSINLSSGGTTPVAVLGSADLDVSDIDPGSLTLGTSGVKTVGSTDRTMCSIVDVSGDFSSGLEGAPDGFNDLVCHFVTLSIVPEAGNAQAKLSGELHDSTPIEGMDSVNIVP